MSTRQSITFSNDSAFSLQGTHKSAKSSFFAQGKFDSYFKFFIFTFCYMNAIDWIVSVQKVGTDKNEMNLVQYFIGYVFVGIPIYYMQMVLGRYSQTSIIYFKHMLPLGHGIIYISLFVAFLYTVKYGLFMGDFCLYFLLSWQRTLPWMQCTENNVKKVWGKCFSGMNKTVNCTNNCLNKETYSSSALYYLGSFLEILPNSTNTLTVDFPSPYRSMGIACAWTVIVLFSILYHKFSKILLILLFQFYICIILLNLGTTSTTGGMIGLKYLFHEDFDTLSSAYTWVKSISVPLKELRLAHPFIILNASRLKTTNNIGVIAVAVTFISFASTLLCSMFYHSCIGMISRASNTPMNKIMHIGEDYEVTRYFVLIPQSLGYLAVPQIWSLLYFVCTMSIILLNEIMFINTLHATVAEVWPSANRYKTYILSGYCGFSCLICLCIAGETNFAFADHFRSTLLVITEVITVTFMSIMVFWIYGVRKLCDDICFMTGVQPTKFWKIAWYLMPLVTFFAAFKEREFYLTTMSTNRKVWINIWLIICMSPIPIFIFIEIFRHMKSRNLTGLIRSTYLWGPPDPEEKHRRQLFNPRKMTTYQSKQTACSHNCLLKSKILRNTVQAEEECTSKYLESLEEKDTENLSLIDENETENDIKNSISLHKKIQNE